MPLGTYQESYCAIIAIIAINAILMFMKTTTATTETNEEIYARAAFEERESERAQVALLITLRDKAEFGAPPASRPWAQAWADAVRMRRITEKGSIMPAGHSLLRHYA